MPDSGATARIPAWSIRPSPTTAPKARLRGGALHRRPAEPANLLHIHVGQSTRAHARILRLDLSKVAAAPGVVCVLSAADVPGRNDISPIAGDEPMFPDETVRFVGQPLFAVAAESLPKARAAAALALVEYEDLPAYLTIATAGAAGEFIEAARPCGWATRRPPSPRRATRFRRPGHRRPGSLLPRRPGGAGGSGRGRRLHVWSSTQNPTETQHLIARRWGCATMRWWSKSAGWAAGSAARRPSRSTMRPSPRWRPQDRRAAKIRLDRDDDMVMTGKRHAFVTDWRVGFGADGVLHGAASSFPPAAATRRTCRWRSTTGRCSTRTTPTACRRPTSFRTACGRTRFPTPPSGALAGLRG